LYDPKSFCIQILPISSPSWRFSVKKCVAFFLVDNSLLPVAMVCTCNHVNRYFHLRTFCRFQSLRKKIDLLLTLKMSATLMYRLNIDTLILWFCTFSWQTFCWSSESGPPRPTSWGEPTWCQELRSTTGCARSSKTQMIRQLNLAAFWRLNLAAFEAFVREIFRHWKKRIRTSSWFPCSL